MEDWSDILTPMQWSKAVKLPVIVYKDTSGAHPIANLIPLKIDVDVSDVNSTRNSKYSALASSRGTIITDKVYLQRHKSDPINGLKSDDDFRNYPPSKLPVKVGYT